MLFDVNDYVVMWLCFAHWSSNELFFFFHHVRRFGTHCPSSEALSEEGQCVPKRYMW